MRYTQKQLAEMANVSVVTLYNALHQPHKVRPATRQRIQDLVRRVEMTQEAALTPEAHKRIVGVLVPNLEIRYYAHLTAEIEKRLAVSGYRTIIGQHGDNPKREAEVLGAMAHLPVDGIIVRNCGTDSDRETFLQLNAGNLPFVLIDGNIPGLEERFVGSDDLTGSQLLTTYLLELGKSRIAYIGMHSSGNFRCSNRYIGYTAALRQAGITPDPRLEAGCSTEYDSGPEEMMRILSATPDEAPDAVFCFNDNTAMNVIRHLSVLGIRAQQDILVAGYGGYLDNVSLPFPLPTVRQNTGAIGRFAAERLMAEIEKRPFERGCVCFAGTLIRD